MFENLPSLFERQGVSRQATLERRIETLNAKLATKDEVIAEIMADFIEAKKGWGRLMRVWVQPHIRDEIVRFVGYYA